MILINQLKMDVGFNENDLIHKIIKTLKIKREQLISYEIVKESLDARKKPDLFYVLNVAVTCKNETQEAQIVKNIKNKDVCLAQKKEYIFPEMGTAPLRTRPVIVGSGPAGLYCGYFLAKHGYAPILLERGEDVDARFESVQKFWEESVLNTESNVQFGEGGAGTFSDGKLNTLNKDPFLRNKEVLKVFVEMGAKKSILYEQKPHLGTDVLMKIVKNLRESIINAGGEVHFNSKVTKLMLDKEQKVSGVMVNEDQFISADVVIMAIGHSARDTFQMLYDENIPMEAKEFAVGYRVIHPQEMINDSQYGKGNKKAEALSAASYKLTAQTQSGRGVYSFCMCPGGYVVNASSEEKRLVVNGMSYSGRDSKSANSAIIVSVKKTDYEDESPLAGVRFQQKLEENAYKIGQGKIPLQLYGDFKGGKISKEFGEVVPCMKGNYTFANLRELLPEELNTSFMEGMEQFDRKIQGFAREDAIVCGVESRTSSPLRILRDNKTLESNVKGLYPCGEGAGYAGGITSAAADGIRVAEEIAKKYSNENMINITKI